MAPQIKTLSAFTLGGGALEEGCDGYASCPLTTAYGGWSAPRADQFLRFAKSAFDGKVNLGAFRG